MSSFYVDSKNDIKPMMISASLEPDKLKFTINRDVKFNIVIPNGQRIDQLDQSSEVCNIIENGAHIEVISDRNEVIPWCTARMVLSTVANFIKFSNTEINGCFGGTGKFAGDLEPRPFAKRRASARLPRPRTFPLFNLLPQEIKDMVLDMVVEPHTVRVYRRQPPEGYIVIVDRDWTDIALFHVCYDFRQYAIKKFGVPTRERSFPFDPKNDVLYMRKYSRRRLSRLYHTNHGKPTVGRQPAFTVRPCSDYINHEVWDRVRTVESEARMPNELRCCVPNGAGSIFRNIETWRILVIQLDTCRGGHHTDATALFLGDIAQCILNSIKECLNEKEFYSWKPKVIEICRKGTMCSKADKL